MKFRIHDVDRARDCIQWLSKNIGELKSSQGIVIRGEGWTANLIINEQSKVMVDIELNQHVDEQDLTMIMLRWA